MGSRDAGFLSAVKTLVDQFSALSSTELPTGPANVKPPEASKESIHRDSIFCSVCPLGLHLDSETREKIGSNQYVDIWCLLTIINPVDKEHRVPDSKYDRKPHVPKTMNNWLQAFTVLGCIMGQKHPKQCSQLFIYLDTIYNTYKTHGGMSWWQYDEDFRRRLSLQPDIGWDVKFTDVWMLPQGPRPFSQHILR